jgi:hypothetical protein
MREHVAEPSASVSLDVSKLDAALYFISVRNDKEVFTSTFIKQ